MREGSKKKGREQNRRKEEKNTYEKGRKRKTKSSRIGRGN